MHFHVCQGWVSQNPLSPQCEWVSGRLEREAAFATLKCEIEKSRLYQLRGTSVSA